MKIFSRILSGLFLSVVLVATALGQQSPIMTVSFTSVDSSTGAADKRANENWGNVGTAVDISALAVGTFPAAGFVYTFSVNGQLLGTPAVAPANGTPATLSWTPPEPGVYFFTVKASDGANTANALPVRFFAVGTKIISPVAGTLVPNGSSVVIQATAQGRPGANAVTDAFVQRIDFYADGQQIGSDDTYPYSIIYTPPATPTAHVIDAKAYDNNGNLIPGSAAKTLNMVTPIGQPPTCAISSPPNNTAISIPTGSNNLTVGVDAHSSSGQITKVELYIDGVLFGSSSAFPYTFTWHPSVTKTYNLVALAYDDRNNVTASTTSTTATITPAPTSIVIASPPTVAISSPTPGATLTGGSPTQLRATASDSDGFPISSVQFFVDSIFVGQATTPSSGNLFTVTATLTQKKDADGNVLPSSITALATNSVGITGVSPAVSVNITSGGSGTGTVIGQPPTVLIPSPVAATELAVNKPVLITANASDTDGNIVSVQFFANNQAIGSTTSYPYSSTWTPTSLGSYSLTVRATDNDGNTVTSSAVQVSVVDPSPNPPSVSIAAPVNGSVLVVGAPQTLRANATDAVSVASVQFFVNGQPQGGLVTGFPFVTSWTPTTPGIYTITARAINAGGNQATSAASTVVVSNGAAPTVGITSPSSGFLTTAGLSVTLSANAFDSDGTVAGVRFFVNGTPVGTALTTAPYTVTWTPSSGGIYTVVAQATDNVGNITNSSPIIVNVAANSLPTVAVVSPANGSTVRVNAGTVIKATASDSDGTIASVQFFVNGVSLGSVTTFPYQTTWTPSAEGVYRLTAVATDNTGAITTSSTVLAIGSATSGDTVATGSYQGVGSAGGIENGNFALISAIGKTAAFIGYSTTSGANRAYFYSAIPVSSTGSYSLADGAGKNLISGLASETGTSGTLDSARLAFIGPDVITSGSVLTSALYSGTLTGKTSSKVAAILGADGSIIFYVLDGSFEDAGGGGFTGKVDGTGAFNLLTMRGNRITGKVDLSTRVLTGALSGADTGQFSIAPTSLSAAAAKVTGSAMQVRSDVVHPQTHNTYDQILLQGPSATITADPGQITRLSYVDTSLDIVQVEFSGAGSLSITLDNYSGPAPAANYDQPDVQYVKGHAGIVVNGADETTNLSIFSVGRANAVDQSLFKSNVKYDGIADLAYVVILTTDGKFGGLRAGDASFFATKGLAGICAPGVQFTGPVYVNDISAADTANPMLLFSSAPDVRVTGGDLWQSNGQPLQIGGVSELKFTDGTNSAGDLLPAQNNKARLQQNGVDVAGLAVMQPAP